MTMAALNCKLLPIVRQVLMKSSAGCLRTVMLTQRTDRLFSYLGTRCQLHNEQGTVGNTMIAKVDKFGGITVHLNERDFPPDVSESAFDILLRDSLSQWRAEGRVAVWLQVPIAQSRFVAAAAAHGFAFHHARRDQSTLCLWLGEGESRLPSFATHQDAAECSGGIWQFFRDFKAVSYGLLGDSPKAFWECVTCTAWRIFPWPGAVLDERSGKVLVVQDKNKTKNAWKFPGGLSDLAENIGDTAVREVQEETGIQAEFQSLLSVRQQHNHPGAFGMSDMYLICRLRPLTFNINFCTQECLRCEWIELEELARTSATTPITSRVARLLLHGLRHGFHHIDLPLEQLPAVYSGTFYQLYHRALPAGCPQND